jgi:hypothetical protein
MHPSKLNKIWLILGLVFVGLGLYNLLSYGYLGSLLTIAIGGLVVYTSVYNMGGWSAALREFGIDKTPGLRKMGRTKSGRRW